MTPRRGDLERMEFVVIFIVFVIVMATITAGLDRRSRTDIPPQHTHPHQEPVPL